jgi:hypothetical protein
VRDAVKDAQDDECENESSSNRKLLAHFRRHTHWLAGLRVYPAPECSRD